MLINAPRKAVISLFILLFSFSVCHAQTTDSANSSIASKQNGWQDYEIDDDTALAMEGYVTRCQQRCTKPEKIDKKENRKKEIREALGKNYKVKGTDYLTARYRPEDVARYNRLNSNPGESVEGKETKILRVKIKARNEFGKMTTFYKYFDICTVCPPPTPC